MEDFTAEELEQLMSVFKDQAASVLDDMAQDILTLEGNGADQEAMARLRRAAHTIKGDSACVGLEGVTGLAHRLEDIIEAARAGALKFDVAVVNVLFESLDEMRAAITGTDVADIDAVTLARLLDEIAALEQSADPVDSKTDETETEAAPGAHEDHDAGTGAASNRNGDHASDVVGPTLDAYQREQIKMAIDRGHQTYLLPVETQYFDAVSGAMGASDSLAQPLFELPAENGNGHERRLVIDTAMSPEAFVSWLERELPHPQGSPSWNERVVWVEGTSETGLVISRLAAENASARGGPETNAAKGRRGSEYVRVEAARIDTLLNLAGEMVISRSAMAQVLPDLEAAFPKNDLVARFSSASVQMGKLIAELQKSVLKMRMVTIDHVFRRFNRPMRELASESGKQVDLEISGGETELDRSLVDLIYEPILHLLRNAVDHGLEPTEEREAKGKPKSGKIRMRAYHEGNQVVIAVTDDGRGIDVQALKGKATLSGYMTERQAQEMTDDAALELIFASGLSTAPTVTRVSGRGIGASAVKSVVEELRGSVTVKSTPGKGTSFELRMPLTLAIIKALLFRVSGQVFALPLLVVREVARASNDDMIYLDDFESFRLRDRFISVVRPARVFGIDRRVGGKGVGLRSAAGSFFVVITTIGGKRFGIVADSLIGEQELVIKPLDSEWLHNEALAGASLLGDGSVVLIMDAGAIFKKAVRFENNKGAMELAAQAR